MQENILDTDELISQAIAGDRVATEKLFLRHYGDIRSHILCQIPGDIGGPINADDIVQRTFAKAYRSIRKFETRSNDSFLAWLRTIASNQLRDVRRHNLEVKSRAKRPADADDAESTFRILLERLGDTGIDPADFAMRGELIAALQVALANLPEDHREAIRYRIIEDRPLPEVAELMGRSIGSVRALCYRAKTMLREELERLSRFI
jgi:RNA polymerase sigma-70 factor (ECF subfamily)